MASIQTTLSAAFPAVQWTGGSGIHLSVASETVLSVDFANKAAVLKMFDTASVGRVIHKLFVARFPHVEWLMGSEEFHKLFMADMARFLNGLPSLETPSRLTNKVTGNKFHRMALFHDFVGGFRSWLYELGPDNTAMGFRFRWERLEGGEEENVREDARERIRVAEEEYVQVELTFMEVAEPPKAAVHEVELQLEKL